MVAGDNIVEVTARVYKSSKCKSVAEFSKDSGDHFDFVEKVPEIIDSLNAHLKKLPDFISAS